MLNEINLKNFKSFKDLNYKFENINILIGGNGSGKSNFLDALEFIKLISNNSSDKTILDEIRGKSKFLKTFNNSNLVIEAMTKLNSTTNLKKVFSLNKENEIITKIIDEKKIEKSDILNFQNILKNIVILDPIPREIRKGDKITSDTMLLKDCSNLISFVINSKIENLEKQLLNYLKKLLGENIRKVEFKTLGENSEFCQLYIQEKIGRKIENLHSDIASDGTLRFIAIITALLSQKKGTILAIEEFDNGIAPSRTKMLLDIIDEISLKREIDVIVTTHNTSLMNYVSEKLFEYIFYVYKDKKGYSKIKRVKDIERVAKMMSYGDIGELMEKDKIIEFIESGENHE